MLLLWKQKSRAFSSFRQWKHFEKWAESDLSGGRSATSKGKANEGSAHVALRFLPKKQWSSKPSRQWGQPATFPTSSELPPYSLWTTETGELFPKLKIPMQLSWESRWSFPKPGNYTWAHSADSFLRLGLLLTPPPRYIPTFSSWPPFPLQPPRPGHCSHLGMTGPVGPGRDLFGVIRPQALGLLRWLALKTYAASSRWRDPKIGLRPPQGDQLLGMELGTPQVAGSRE